MNNFASEFYLRAAANVSLSHLGVKSAKELIGPAQGSACMNLTQRGELLPELGMRRKITCIVIVGNRPKAARCAVMVMQVVVGGCCWSQQRAQPSLTAVK